MFMLPRVTRLLRQSQHTPHLQVHKIASLSEIIKSSNRLCTFFAGMKCLQVILGQLWHPEEESFPIREWIVLLKPRVAWYK